MCPSPGDVLCPGRAKRTPKNKGVVPAAEADEGGIPDSTIFKKGHQGDAQFIFSEYWPYWRKSTFSGGFWRDFASFRPVSPALHTFERCEYWRLGDGIFLAYHAYYGTKNTTFQDLHFFLNQQF